MTLPTKYDLSDVTFLIPVRIDSVSRKENLEILLKVISRDFTTNFIILEADVTNSFYKPKNIKNLSFHFIYDEDPIFYHTHYRNKMLLSASTPYVGVWDTDILAQPFQIIKAVEMLRQNNAVMAYPFDRRCYKVNEILRKVFQKTLKFELLTTHLPAMDLQYGYQTTGGAFLVNRKEYIAAGMENENFYGWGEEDNERIKRMEIRNLSIYYAQGPLFHLWHPRGVNSWYPSEEIEFNNRSEFLKTCSGE
jgi:predicted glycosyltransferase involved in capsule biosynthesis